MQAASFIFHCSKARLVEKFRPQKNGTPKTRFIDLLFYTPVFENKCLLSVPIFLMILPQNVSAFALLFKSINLK